MFANLVNILNQEGITEIGMLPIESCRMLRPHLLEKAEKICGEKFKSVFCFLVPYYTGEGENISAYAVSEDYHLYMKDLFARICPLLESAHRGHRFVGFSDHSPIDERDAVLQSGIAIKGDNRLLLHREYGSFFFVGEIFSTLTLGSSVTQVSVDRQSCLHCGACRAACPGGALCDENRPCLSALTQKKGALTAEEETLIFENQSAWGCDKCQTVCPYNQGRITPIAFFHSSRLPRLTRKMIETMSEEEFSRRAFSWRGRETILRNLDILSGRTQE